MLDLAFGLTETSRLGCQVKMSKELDGLVVCNSIDVLEMGYTVGCDTDILQVKLPSMTRNMQASDFGGENPKH